ncbi:MAG: dihydrodipicolinate synthase family protein [Aggregatilineales bacterium]
MQWQGVMPAITTPFDKSYRLPVDHAFLATHCKWLVDCGCTGIVALGSLGEAATLDYNEKLAVVKTCVEAVGARVPVVAGISALSTPHAKKLTKAVADTGCQGLMVLPPYVYKGDWREMKAYVTTIIKATPLSCMLYNNPIAYGTDFLPEHIQELAAEHPNLHAVKESSADVSRITAIRALIGDRLSLMVGVDDLIVESVYAGADGWIAGLVNAFPELSVALFNYAKSGNHKAAAALYSWFLPLLRMATVPKFVQLIKLVQYEVEMGNALVRPPRLQLEGAELQEAKATIAKALAKISED